MKKSIIFLTVYFLLMITGFLILIKSPSLGTYFIGRFWRINMGGSGDLSVYSILLEQYIASYRWLGGILLSGGFLGMIEFARK